MNLGARLKTSQGLLVYTSKYVGHIKDPFEIIYDRICYCIKFVTYVANDLEMLNLKTSNFLKLLTDADM